MYLTGLISDIHPAYLCIANYEYLRNSTRETTTQPLKSTGKPTPVYLTKGEERLYFPSITAAANRLYTTTGMICKARDRRQTVRGWKVIAP